MSEFKDVVGYENLFQISKSGKVFSKRTNKILKTTISSTGYLVLATRIGGRGGKAVLLRIHRLIAEAFIPNPENKPCVNHKDGNKLNNSVNNLEWVTYSENTRHAYNTDLINTPSGCKNPLCKLTEQDIEYIKSKYTPRDKEFGARPLAKKYGVSHSTILNSLNY